MWSVLEIKVIFGPTPFWGGVKGIVVVRNSKVPILLLTTSDGVTIGLGINLTCIVKVTRGKCMISKHVPFLIGMTNLLVTIDYSPWLGPKVVDVTYVIL